MLNLSKIVARVSTAVLLALPISALAQFPSPGGPHEAGFPRMPMRDLPPELPFDSADPGSAMHYPLLRGLRLDENQADKVFNILHAQTPAMREASKALRKAQEELRALALSAKYDGTKARALSDAASRAIGELAMLRADGDHRIWDLLTEEQRAQVEVIQRPRGRP